MKKKKIPRYGGDTRPSCDFCHREADYEGWNLTLRGMWGYMCREHFSSIDVGIGFRKGQEIITVKEGKTCGEGDTV